jgi:hypothetical protein
VTNAIISFGFFCSGIIESLAVGGLRECSVTTNEIGTGFDISFTSGDVIWLQELGS